MKLLLNDIAIVLHEDGDFSLFLPNHKDNDIVSDEVKALTHLALMLKDRGVTFLAQQFDEHNKEIPMQ